MISMNLTTNDSISTIISLGIPYLWNHGKLYLMKKCTLMFSFLLGVQRDIVLGLARTGLIFTGLQEGAQPGGGG